MDINTVTNASEAWVQTQTVNVIDDDSAFVELTIDTGSIAEASGAVVFTVSTLSGVTSTTGITVTLNLSWTAIGWTDYTGTTLTVTIPAGQTGITFTLSALQDLIVEWNEDIIVDINTVTNASEAWVQTQTVNVIDDDSAFVELTIDTGSIAEASGAVVFTVSTLSGVTSTTGITVTLNLSWTAIGWTDYTGTTLTVTIPAGQTGITFTLSALQDLIVEWNEDIIVDINTVTNASEAWVQTQTVNVIDDDSAFVELTIDTGSIAEASGAVVFTVSTLSGVTSTTGITVTLNLSWTAIGWTDYTGTTLTVTIPAGQTGITFTLSALQDLIVEWNEDIIVDINTVTNASEAWVQTQTVNVIDDDSAFVELTIDTGSIAEASGAVVFTVSTLSGVTSTTGITVTLNLSWTAIGWTDYTGTTLTVTIPAGQTGITFTLSALQDLIVEWNEDIIVDINTVTNASEAWVQTQTVNVIDDDSAFVELTIDTGSIAEASGAVVFTVSTLSGVTSTTGITVTLNLSWTAIGWTDYTGTTLTVTIPAGQTGITFTLSALQDLIVEWNEDIIVDINTVTNASEAWVQTQTVNVIDDDSAFVELTIDTGSIAEASGAVVFTVSTLSGVTSTTGITVTLNLSWTAIGWTDYTGTTLTVTIPAGQTGITFTLSALQDLIVEWNEDIIVDINTVTNASEAWVQTQTVNVIDDEVCGNGTINAGEACDDTNTTAWDGCDAVCALEDGFVCAGEASVCVSTTTCGNGIIWAGEGCDDGNNINSDSCSSICLIEDGAWVCDADADCLGWSCDLLAGTCNPTLPAPVCGDGDVAIGESCDDSNTTNWDGCSSVCDIEPGFECVGQASICNVSCWDATLDINEACDDSNLMNGDGCDNSCKVETNFVCESEPSECISTLTCGNGVVWAGEACDDGNNTSNDGCSATCVLEDWAWVCTMNSDCISNSCIAWVCAPTAPAPVCWNANVEVGESCDDGDAVAWDGCSAVCDVEPGFECTGDPSICAIPAVQVHLTWFTIVPENGWIAPIRVYLSGGTIAAVNITVTLMISWGTAINGTDHTGITFTVTILAGTTGTTFNVTALQDFIFEWSEFTQLMISATSGSNSSVGMINLWQVTILDDDILDIAIYDPTNCEGHIWGGIFDPSATLIVRVRVYSGATLVHQRVPPLTSTGAFYIYPNYTDSSSTAGYTGYIAPGTYTVIYGGETTGGTEVISGSYISFLGFSCPTSNGWGWGGWGGWGLSKDYCPNWDLSPSLYDRQCTKAIYTVTTPVSYEDVIARLTALVNRTIAITKWCQSCSNDYSAAMEHIALLQSTYTTFLEVWASYRLGTATKTDVLTTFSAFATHYYEVRAFGKNCKRTCSVITWVSTEVLPATWAKTLKKRR
jgi:cysteine-rich repeat protein